MIVQHTYVYIQIGLCLRLLRNVSISSKPPIAKTTIKTLKENLQTGNFEVSLASMKAIDYGKMNTALEELADDVTLPPNVATMIKDKFKAIENVVFAEAITKRIYVLPSRRFNTECLLAEPHKLLKAGAFEKLEEIAKLDFASSCRCILFGEATASAFHILRATESVLKSYYCHHRRQKRLAKPMWGNMVDQLRAKSKNKPPVSLLASLDLIRTAYRNPTQHPEAIYEIDSAQDLFGVCLDVIGKMAEEL
ncbi:MAG: hypothetical protein ABL916_21175 [Burkholderiaceae bacterium]